MLRGDGSRKTFSEFSHRRESAVRQCQTKGACLFVYGICGRGQEGAGDSGSRICCVFCTVCVCEEEEEGGY